MNSTIEINLKLKKNYFPSKFRESRNKDGNKTYLNLDDRLETIKSLHVENVETNEIFENNRFKFKKRINLKIVNENTYNWFTRVHS